MCGATQQQKDITDEQQQFYTNLTNQYNTVFGQNQAITGALTSAFQPILAAGPSQTGFSPSEDTALRTQNAEGVATNYAQAQRATANILAARGGGNDMLPSSIDANMIARNANDAAAARSQGDLGITQANYAQGYKNWTNAGNMLAGTAGLLNPTSYSGQATGAGGAASSSAAAVAAAANSPWNAAFGALSSIGGAALTGGMSFLPTATSAASSLLSSGANSPFAGYNSWQNMAPPPIYSGPGMTGPVPAF